jgi:hypothetical protein
MSSRFQEIDLSKLTRVPIEKRGGTVNVDSFVSPVEPGREIDGLLSMIPGTFAGADFKKAVAAVASSGLAGRPGLAMFGAHFIKCGLSRLLIDLMERGIVTAVAMNGACAIHDYEIAMWGVTSEDVAGRLEDGSFGMCSDTADGINGAIVEGAKRGAGFGESIGERIVGDRAPHLDASILGRASELGIPATVHVGLGTDIVHQHASADGAAIGETSLRDFRIVTRVVGGLEEGCVLNIGSAVILPEVFLKAFSVARNLGFVRGALTTISMDMNEPYRVLTNVIRRPTAHRGTGIALRGRHELLFPLFWAAVIRGMQRGRTR